MMVHYSVVFSNLNDLPNQIFDHHKHTPNAKAVNFCGLNDADAFQTKCQRTPHIKSQSAIWAIWETWWGKKKKKEYKVENKAERNSSECM